MSRADEPRAHEGITFENVTFRYRDAPATELANITFSAASGSLVACVGSSGSGKTTLLRLAAGLEVPTSGEVRLWGENPAALPPAARRVGFLAQDVSVYGHLSVLENVFLPMRSREQGTEEELRARAAEILDSMRLAQYARRRVETLSGGERQRVALARILGWSPRVLCLDEPLASVDAVARVELLRLIQDTHRRLGGITLFVTHAASESLAVADTVLVLDRGCQLQQASPEEIYAEPAHIFVSQRLADTPVRVVRGRLDATDALQVVLENGTVLGVTGHSGSSEKEILLAFRASDFLIRDRADGERGLSGTVQRIHYQGHRYVVECATALGSLYGVSYGRFALDATVAMVRTADATAFFSAATGLRAGSLHLAL
jgi:putative spermidine/putrescine transport system ATP-binding protein